MARCGSQAGEGRRCALFGRIPRLRQRYLHKSRRARCRSGCAAGAAACLHREHRDITESTTSDATAGFYSLCSLCPRWSLWKTDHQLFETCVDTFGRAVGFLRDSPIRTRVARNRQIPPNIRLAADVPGLGTWPLSESNRYVFWTMDFESIASANSAKRPLLHSQSIIPEADGFSMLPCHPCAINGCRAQINVVPHISGLVTIRSISVDVFGDGRSNARRFG
jgi:hypothetical protein